MLFESASARGLFRPLLAATDFGYAIGPAVAWTLVGAGVNAQQLLYLAGAIEMTAGLAARAAAPTATTAAALPQAGVRRGGGRDTTWGAVVHRIEVCCYR